MLPIINKESGDVCKTSQGTTIWIYPNIREYDRRLRDWIPEAKAVAEQNETTNETRCLNISIGITKTRQWTKLPQTIHFTFPAWLRGLSCCPPRATKIYQPHSYE